MKSVLSVVFWVAVVCVPLVNGEGGDDGHEASQGGEPSATLPPRCPLPDDSGVRGESRMDILFVQVFECNVDPLHNGTNIVDLMRAAETAEALLAVAREFCSKSSSVAPCVAETFRTSETCLNASQHDVIKIMADFLKILRESSCTDEGVRMATIVKEFRTLNRTHKIVKDCVKEAKISELDDLHYYDASLMSAKQFRELKQFKQCLGLTREENAILVEQSNSLFTEALSKVHCIDQAGAKVLCETLDE